MEFYAAWDLADSLKRKQEEDNTLEAGLQQLNLEFFFPFCATPVVSTMRTLGPQAMLLRWNFNRFSHSSWQVLKERAAKLGVHVASLGREVTEPQEPREESPPWRSLRRRKSRKVATVETTPRGEPERKAEEQPEEATTAEQALAASSSWRCQPDTTAGTTAWEPVAASSEPRAAAEEVDKEPAEEGWWSGPRAEPVRGYASKAADGPFYETCQERFESM